MSKSGGSSSAASAGSISPEVQSKLAPLSIGRLDWLASEGVVKALRFVFGSVFRNRHFPGLASELPATARIDYSSVPVYLYGSFANGFCTRGSFDCDLVYLQPDLDIDAIIRAIRNLNRGKFLKASNRSDKRTPAEQLLDGAAKYAGCESLALTSNVIDLRHARVPILKFALTLHIDGRHIRVACDLALNGSLKGVVNSRVLFHYSKVDPRVRPIGVFIKHWAKRRSVIASEHHFMNSYSVILMVLFYLQHCRVVPVLRIKYDVGKLPDHISSDEFPFLPEERQTIRKWQSLNTATVDELILGFFKFYGHEFDFQKNGISVRSGASVLRATISSDYSFSDRAIWLEDPIDLTDNAARQIDQLQFAGILHELRRAYELFQVSGFLDMMLQPVDPRDLTRDLGLRAIGLGLTAPAVVTSYSETLFKSNAMLAASDAHDLRSYFTVMFARYPLLARVFDRVCSILAGPTNPHLPLPLTVLAALFWAFSALSFSTPSPKDVLDPAKGSPFFTSLPAAFNDESEISLSYMTSCFFIFYGFSPKTMPSASVALLGRKYPSFHYGNMVIDLYHCTLVRSSAKKAAEVGGGVFAETKDSPFNSSWVALLRHHVPTFTDLVPPFRNSCGQVGNKCWLGSLSFLHLAVVIDHKTQKSRGGKRGNANPDADAPATTSGAGAAPEDESRRSRRRRDKKKDKSSDDHAKPAKETALQKAPLPVERKQIVVAAALDEPQQDMLTSFPQTANSDRRPGTVDSPSEDSEPSEEEWEDDEDFSEDADFDHDDN